MKRQENNKEVSRLQEPAVAYGGGRVGNLRREIEVVVGRIDNEAVLEECLKVLKQGASGCELDRAIREARNGEVVSFDNVREAMDFLNA